MTDSKIIPFYNYKILDLWKATINYFIHGHNNRSVWKRKKMEYEKYDEGIQNIFPHNFLPD